MRKLFKALSLWRDAKAASRGPEALGKRYVRKQAFRRLGGVLRRWLR